MALASLADLKSLLGIPADDVSRDVSLQLALDAVEALLLDLTGYSLEEEEDRVDIFENQRSGSVLQLTRRPVVGTPVLEGRSLGSDTFIPLSGSLADPRKGAIRLLGLTDVTGFDYPGAFPPRPEPSGYFRWRGYNWGVVRVTYNVGALDPIPADLKAAALHIAGVQEGIASTGSKGPITSLTVGNVTEVAGAAASGAMSVSIPPNALGMIARHILQTARMTW